MDIHFHKCSSDNCEELAVCHDECSEVCETIVFCTEHDTDANMGKTEVTQ